MASLKCEVVKVEIHEHPDADAIEIAQVRGYQSIVKKGQFKDGDLAVYIPEQSVVPAWVLRRLNMWDDERGKGGLAGAKGNRVKAVKLRGVTSQGLLFPLFYKAPPGDIILHDGEGWLLEKESGDLAPVYEGKDVTDLLGVIKYEPPIPVCMAGEVVGIHGKTLKYDIENVKNYPHIANAVMNLGIEVEITEKLHGTWACIAVYADEINPEIPYGRVVVTSKGLSSKGLAFKDNEANKDNLYMKMFKTLFPDENTFRSVKYLPARGEAIFFLGEIFGKGVQDLQYGLNDVEFRVFDVYDGLPGQGRYWSSDRIQAVIDSMELPFSMVPKLYEGPLSWEVIDEYTNGMDSITGSHIREGIVIRTVDREYRSPEMGRVILKSVSEDYLTRRGGTELN